MKDNTLLVVGAMLTAGMIFFALNGPKEVTLGAAPTGIDATPATTSAIVVNSTQRLLFATSTCSARVITATGDALRLTFRDQDIPTGAFGHLQATGTSVVYDGGLYGCDAFRVYSNSSQTVTVTETR